MASRSIERWKGRMRDSLFEDVMHRTLEVGAGFH